MQFYNLILKPTRYENILIKNRMGNNYFCRTVFVLKMNKLKEKILETCKSLQLETINNLKSEIEEVQNAANEYGLPKDRYDSFRAQLLRKKDMFGQQLAKANEQLEILMRINPDKNYSMAEFGAVIITNKQKLVISIGLGKVLVGEDVFFAISPAVPIYKAMEGKKVGEEFAFNNNSYKIEKIF